MTVPTTHINRATKLKRILAMHPTVTPREVAQLCYGADDDEAYEKALFMLRHAVKTGIARRVCKGVYQRAGDWRLPEPIEAMIAAASSLRRGDTNVLSILESGLQAWATQ